AWWLAAPGVCTPVGDKRVVLARQRLISLHPRVIDRHAGLRRVAPGPPVRVAPGPPVKPPIAASPSQVLGGALGQRRHVREPMPRRIAYWLSFKPAVRTACAQLAICGIIAFTAEACPHLRRTIWHNGHEHHAGPRSSSEELRRPERTASARA